MNEKKTPPRLPSIHVLSTKIKIKIKKLYKMTRSLCGITAQILKDQHDYIVNVCSMHLGCRDAFFSVQRCQRPSFYCTR